MPTEITTFMKRVFFFQLFWTPVVVCLEVLVLDTNVKIFKKCRACEFFLCWTPFFKRFLALDTFLQHKYCSSRGHDFFDTQKKNKAPRPLNISLQHI